MHCQPYHFIIRVRKECFGNFVASSTFPLPRKAKRIFSPPFRTTRYRTPLSGIGLLLVAWNPDFVLQLFQFPMLDLELRLGNQGRGIHSGMTFEAEIAAGLLRHAGARFPTQERHSGKPLRAATARQPLIALWGCWHVASLNPLALVPDPAICKIHAALLHEPFMLLVTPHIDGFRLYFVPLRVPPVRPLSISYPPRPALPPVS